MKINFDLVQPPERHIILVADDAKYKELCNRPDFWKVVNFVLNPSNAIADASFSSTYLSSTLNTYGVFGAGDLKRLFKVGKIPIPHLTQAESVQRFSFDHQHPQNGMVYLMNATRDSHYLVPAIANERLAQDKVAAFYEIAGTLGTKKLELVSGNVVETTAKGKVEVPLPEVAGQVGINASFGANNELQRHLSAEFGEPLEAPFVPDHLARWLDVDPLLSALVRNRINGQVSKTRFSLNIGNTLDVNAEVVASLANNFKVGVGGAYKHVARSTWSFDIEFWPKSSA